MKCRCRSCCRCRCHCCRFRCCRCYCCRCCCCFCCCRFLPLLAKQRRRRLRRLFQPLYFSIFFSLKQLKWKFRRCKSLPLIGPRSAATDSSTLCAGLPARATRETINAAKHAKLARIGKVLNMIWNGGLGYGGGGKGVVGV